MTFHSQLLSLAPMRRQFIQWFNLAVFVDCTDHRSFPRFRDYYHPRLAPTIQAECWAHAGFSHVPDGKLLAAALDKDVFLWDMASGKQLGETPFVTTPAMVV